MKQEAALSIEEETKLNFCNCDANLPVALTDSGTITNSSALPMVKLYFGGLTYEIQYATMLPSPWVDSSVTVFFNLDIL